MNASMTIGVVPMSAKPYHLGHDRLIRLAAKENDHVYVFVSLSDRKRKGEITISGAAMSTIWINFIEPTLPDNVTVDYVTSPVAACWAFIGGYNDDHVSRYTFRIYSDPVDLKTNFPVTRMEKYWSWLYKRNKIVLKPANRNSTVNISGTAMREMLQDGDYESFTAMLPPALRSDAEEIIATLLKQ